MWSATGVASECRYTESDEATEVVAARLWQLIDEAVSSRNSASLILAGGSTPVGVYNLLRELPLPWDAMRICPSDERWVSVDNPASNEGMLGRELLSQSRKPGQFVSLAKRSDSVADDALSSEHQLAANDDPWDVVLLGMGEDGHTASLFPGSADLPQAYDTGRRCVPVMPANAAHQRLTLTPRELLKTRRIVLLLSGERKWEVYQNALSGTDIFEMPVRVILHQDRVPVDVYWSA